jgi:hypothetical protein
LKGAWNVTNIPSAARLTLHTTKLGTKSKIFREKIFFSY